jgi:Tol biopolymer transport system component
MKKKILVSHLFSPIQSFARLGLGSLICFSILVLQPINIACAQVAEMPTATPQETVSAEAAAPTTPEKTQNLAAWISQIQISEVKGLSGRIAFSAALPDPATKSSEYIFVLDLDTRIIRPLVTHPGQNSFPQWSPDGTLLTFSANRGGTKDIYIIDWDGGNERRLTSDSAVDDHPSFAPNNERVTFSSDQGDGTTNIYAVNLTGGERTQVTQFRGRNILPRWSPNGKVIAYTTNRYWPGWDVCLWDLARQSETCPLSGRDSFCRSDFSHTGNFLVYSIGQGKSVNLELIDLKTGARSRSAVLPGKDYDAAWSPNDALIVFASEEPPRSEIYSLNLANVANEEITGLLKAPFSLRYPTWSGVRTLDLEAKRVAEQQRTEGKH